MKSKLYTILACLAIIGLTSAYFFINREHQIRQYQASLARETVAKATAIATSTKTAEAKVSATATSTASVPTPTRTPTFISQPTTRPSAPAQLPTVTIAAAHKNPKPDPSAILLVNTGDMMFDRSVRSRMKKGIDPLEHMDDIKAEIQDDFNLPVDVTVANLEGPITDAPVCQTKAYTFKFASTTGLMLRQNGIDIVSLSNNHSFDCFAQDLVDTRKNLTAAGMGFMGGGGDINNSVYIKTIKGRSLAFVGIDETVRPIPIDNFYPFIQNLATQHDAVIVNIHWGVEYQKEPTATQKAIGRKLVDSGAIAVIGHHPHVTEPFELYNGGVIYYSLGNFIFDQIGIEENKGGVAAIRFDIAKTLASSPTPSPTAKALTISDAKMFPVQIVNSVPCGVSCTHE